MTIYRKLSKTVGRFIRRFTRDQRGIAATEFALVLPIMLTLFGGAVELSNFLTVERKVLSVVQTTADLIGQETDISASDISDIYSATLQILDPYPTTGLSIGVSSVVFDEDTAAASEDWTSSYNGGSVSSATTLAADFEEAGKSVIIVNVRYTYNPILTLVMTSSRTITETAYARPRKVDSINYTG